MIRLAAIEFGDDEVRAVEAVLRSGNLVQGAQVEAFEWAVSEYVGTAHAVAVSSGTAALHLALLALGVGPGDRVIVPTYSWVATANVVEMCGAVPVFVDINRDTFNLEPEKLEATIERLARMGGGDHGIKAIMPVHIFGMMADMPEISRIAELHAIPIIEDAACALGASIEGVAAGSFGKVGCFSFHPRKVITTGEGGMIVTNTAALAERCRVLRNHGQVRSGCHIRFVDAGLNYRLTEMQGALGIVQMRRLDTLLAQRRERAANYDRLFERSGVRPQLCPLGFTPNFQAYVVQLAEGDERSAMDVVNRGREGSVELSVGTWHIPMTDYYRLKYGYKIGDFQNTDDCFRRTIALPLHGQLSVEDQERVVRLILNSKGRL